MKHGALEFLQKPFKDQLLIDAVQSALTRWGTTQAINNQHGEFRYRLTRLTARERDVFDGVALGKRGKQIAADLGLATKTVEEYRARMFKKMHVKTSSELAAMAARLVELKDSGG
jgi:FixJ family two-component response regulator